MFFSRTSPIPWSSRERYERMASLDSISELGHPLPDETIAYLASVTRAYACDCKSWGFRPPMSDLINRAHSYELYVETVVSYLPRRRLSLTWLTACRAKPMRWCWKMSTLCDRQWHSGIKLHLLHLVTIPVCSQDYREGDCSLSQSGECSIICDQLEIIPEHIVIHRITGTPHEICWLAMWSKFSMPLRQKSSWQQARRWNSYVKTLTEDGPVFWQKSRDQGGQMLLWAMGTTPLSEVIGQASLLTFGGLGSSAAAGHVLAGALWTVYRHFKAIFLILATCLITRPDTTGSFGKGLPRFGNRET